MVGYSQIRENLTRQAASRPNLADIIAYELALLALQARAGIPLTKPARLANRATARLAQGKPILLPSEFMPDRVLFGLLAHQICRITAHHFPDWAAELDQIRDWLCHEQTALANLAARFWMTEGIQRGEETSLNEPLLAFVFNQALHPQARKYAKIFGAFVDKNTWYHTTCPICGGRPNCSALEKAAGTRQLICARCDFEWAFWRSACALCGGDNPDQLAYAPTNQPGYLVQTCAQCGGVFPTLALDQFPDERLLVVERNLMQLEYLRQHHAHQSNMG